jgi:spore germination protein
MNKNNVLLCFFPLFLLFGCVDKEILDDVSIENGAAYDILSEKEIIGTVIVPHYLVDQPVENIEFSATGDQRSGIIYKVQQQAADPLVTGSLEVCLFGEELSKKGIIELVDSLQRDPGIGERMYLATTKGEATKLIKQDYGVKGTPLYISDLIRQNIKLRDLPTTNLHLFLYDYYQKGKDPFLPQLENFEKDKVRLSGVSIFKKDKVVDEIPALDLFFFKLLVEKYSEGEHRLDLSDGSQAFVKSINSKNKYKLVSKSPYKISIHIDVDGIIKEYSGDKLDKKVLKTIQVQLEKTVEKKAVQLIKQFQENGVDPLGIGAFVKGNIRGFDFTKWEK